MGACLAAATEQIIIESPKTEGIRKSELKKVIALKDYAALEKQKRDAGKEKTDDQLELKMDAETMLKKRKNVAVLRKYSIHNDYTIGKVIGIGNLGEVRLAMHKVNKQTRCVKLFSKRLCKKDDIRRIFYEINLMCSLDHPSILKVIEYYEDSERIYMITELCTGGDLQDMIVTKKRSKIEEQDVATII